MSMTDTIKEIFTGENTATSLHGLFVETLKDMYHAEKQILNALPTMAENTTSPELRAAFEKHMGQTEEQVERLEQVFKMIGMSPKTKSCEAIQGLVEEGDEVISEFEGEVRDAGLLAGAQAVEHYEIARYGTLIAWAKEMGLDAGAKLLEKTLKEEKETDELLTKIALKSVNTSAANMAGEHNMHKRGKQAPSGASARH